MADPNVCQVVPDGGSNTEALHERLVGDQQVLPVYSV